MTPTESKETMLGLLASTVEASALPAEGWSYTVDVHHELVPDPCTLPTWDPGVNYTSLIAWHGETGTEADVDELVEKVRTHWEAQGLTTRLDIRQAGTSGLDRHVWLVGEGGADIDGIDITVIPGQVTLGGESLCVVDEQVSRD